MNPPTPERSQNVTGRHVPSLGIVAPRTVDEVVAAVQAARRDGVALYPFSTGLNWGYGSASPVLAGCRLLDLSGMNRIRNADDISIDNPVAVIEPGVTQGQLADFLRERHPRLMFNVTGSARDTSILGNALERGVGYLGPRIDDVYGLEVVTGTAEVLRTGFRRLGEDSPLAHAHPFGLGPMLDGLFFQGNFGIVTSACFRLVPRRPSEVAVSLSLRRAEDLGDFIDELGRMKREALLGSVTHIGNRERSHATLAYGVSAYLEQHCGLSGARLKQETANALAIVAPHEWTGLASVAGNAAQVRAGVAEIRQRLKSLASVRVVTRRLLDVAFPVMHRLRRLPFARAQAAAISAMGPLHGLALGEPTDVPVQNLLWHFGHPVEPATALDASRCGLLYICPALPLDGRQVARAAHEMRAIATEHGFALYLTLNIETANSVAGIANLLFDRGSDAQTRAAGACADALQRWMHEAGLSPYRLRADMMQQAVAQDPAYWTRLRELKRVLDPDGIIAPGRYSLP